MRYRPLLIVIVSFLMLQPAVAQQNSKETPQPPNTTVTLTITADLEPAGEHIPRLPTDVMERLSEQDALANFELRAAEGSRVRLNAHYLFPGIDALTSWQESEETQELMEFLDAPGGLEYTVSVRRHQVRQSPRPPQSPDDR